MQNKDGALTTYPHDAYNGGLSAGSGATLTTYTYDLAGNRSLEDTGGNLTTFTWDEENWMTGVVNPDNSTEAMTYAGDGNRRSRVTDEESILYLWDDVNMLEELDESGGLIAHYTDYPGAWGRLTSLYNSEGSGEPDALYNQKGLGDALFNETDNPGSFFYLFDLQASSRELLDDTASVTDNVVYRAFGEEDYSSGSTRSLHRFQGESGAIADENDCVWMQARVYGCIIAHSGGSG